MKTLKKCPFCGAYPLMAYQDTIGDYKNPSPYSVVCGNCGAEIDWYETEEEATEAWNTRMDDKLKNCPFCGGEAVLECWFGRKGFEASISCDCGAMVTEGIYYDSEKEARERTIKLWNERYEPPFNGSVPFGNARLK